MVHQDGSQSPSEKGLEVILFTHEGETVPHLAEIASDEYGAEIGLTFEGRKLIDFDGAFSLPRELALMLHELDCFIPEVCEA